MRVINQHLETNGARELVSVIRRMETALGENKLVMF